MAAKKMSAKKMPAKKASSNDSLDKEIMRRYGLSSTSLVNERGSSSKGKTGAVSRKEYVTSFQDVVSEGPYGQNPKAMAAAARIAGGQWDRTFGPKNKPTKKK